MNNQNNFTVTNPQVKTPYYCFNDDIFIQNVQMMKQKLQGKVKLCYSLKANPWFIESAKKNCDYIEVCSPGEFEICLKSKVPMKQISVGGISKTELECQKIAFNSPHRVSVESLLQIDLLERSAAIYNSSLSILLRLTSGNQFGMPIEMIKKIYNDENKYPHLKIRGIHYYPGTQKKKIEDAKKLIKTLTEVSTIPKVKEIQFGAGFGVPLYTKQNNSEFNSYIEYIIDNIIKLAERCELVLECGRFLTYSTGGYVTTILETKEQCDRKFLIIDGGIHHLSYYGQIDGHQIPIIRKVGCENGAMETYTICGSLCTTNDILAKNILLPIVHEGDQLIFFNVGAYSVTESRALFLSRELPTIVLKYGIEDIIKRKPFQTYQLNSFIL